MDFQGQVAKLIEAEFKEATFRKLPINIYPVFIEAIEKPLIECVLRAVRGNQVRAAEVLGINRNTLRKKCKLHGILGSEYSLDAQIHYGKYEKPTC